MLYILCSTMPTQVAARERTLRRAILLEHHPAPGTRISAEFPEALAARAPPLSAPYRAGARSPLAALPVRPAVALARQPSIFSFSHFRFPIGCPTSPTIDATRSC